MPAVGHGQLGLRDDLRIFDQLTRESSCRADAFVEIEGGAVLSGDTWTPLATAGFELAWSQDFDGERLEVVSLRTIVSEPLTRVETEAQVEATELTWQYDMDEGMLRIHLQSDADPSGNLLLLTTSFNFGTGGASREHMVQPYLGPEKLTDGEFDNATLADWTTTTTGSGFTATRNSTPLVGGGYSALLAGSGSGSGSVSLRQDPDSVAGNRYRLFGYYQTSASQPATATTYIQVDNAALSSNGFTQDAALTNGLALTNTFGRTRAFIFDHITTNADARVVLRLVNSAATACSVRFDRVTYKPITGWRYFHPRVAADGIPESEQGSLDVYAGSASTGSGVVKLLNDDTAPFERMFSGDPWTCLSRDIRIRYGGAFPDNGQEILWDDCFLGQSGFIAGDQFQHVTDEAATFAFEEGRTILEAEIPNQTYGNAWPNVEERDFSRARARFFGDQLHIRAARVDLDGTTGLPIYELNDPTYAVGEALSGATQATAYTDEEAAETQNQGKAYALTDTQDYTVDTATGAVSFIQNPAVFVVTEGEGASNEKVNNKIDFKANGTTYAATVPATNYIAGSLRGAVETAMETISGGSFTVTYDNTTHLFNIQWNGAGTLELLTDTGVNRDRSLLPMLGYTNGTDYVGGTDYDSTTSVLTDVDNQCFIRFDSRGYSDDADGTYTGVADDPVELGPDVFRYIHGVFLAEPASRIDIASFEAARTTCPQLLGVYFGLLASVTDTPAGPVTLQSAVDKFEISGASTAEGLADISQDGAGVFYWRTRANITSSAEVYDRDFLSWEGFVNGNDPYGTVRVNYKQDPSTGYVLGAEVTNTETVLRDRRFQQRTFDSYLTVEADAEDARDALAILARAAIRHFRFRVKGKLLGCKSGDIITITRSRALGASGESTLSSESFRILWIKKNFLTHEVEVVVHTNVLT